MSINKNELLDQYYTASDEICLQTLLPHLDYLQEKQDVITQKSSDLVNEVRSDNCAPLFNADQLMTMYDLSEKEGVALVCMVEAILRIPDKKNINNLIKDQITNHNWENLVKEEEKNILTNISSYGLRAANLILDDKSNNTIVQLIRTMISKMGTASIRTIVMTIVEMSAKKFIYAESIAQAFPLNDNNYLYSYDMLCEGARTEDDAEKYFDSYWQALDDIARLYKQQTNVMDNVSISIKISSLSSNYKFTKPQYVKETIVPKVIKFIEHAKKHNIPVTLDAEEVDRLNISLIIIKSIIEHENLLDGWEGFGIAVQTYQKRAYHLLNMLSDLLRRHGKKMMIRIIKGAYWDTEIKLAQELSLSEYPVFTKKSHTDISYLACADFALQNKDVFFLQFATHNIRSIVSILQLANKYQLNTNEFEMQSLYGMGSNIYNIIKKHYPDLKCRVYAPIGKSHILLPYLIRRLLENGASTSFVNKLRKSKYSTQQVIQDPMQLYNAAPSISLPSHIFADRLNSKGINLDNVTEMENIFAEMEQYYTKQYDDIYPIINGKPYTKLAQLSQISVINPAQHKDIICTCHNAQPDLLAEIPDILNLRKVNWGSHASRGNILNKVADLLEANMIELMAILSREAGKIMEDAISEVREAVDFCRYYAVIIKTELDKGQLLESVTGESNRLLYKAKGVFACISPWNFPLAIFLGQIVAALGTGNIVIIKPSALTPLIAYRVVQILLEAGMPKETIMFLPSSGKDFSRHILSHPVVHGVVFTGSTQVAWDINQTLASRVNTPIASMIAETGGINAMIVDSSALLEQVTDDVIASAFRSAGQRCSALRLLYVQEEIYDDLSNMIIGAMKDLIIGIPSELSTDVGPIIDNNSVNSLNEHINKMSSHAQLLYKCDIPETYNKHTSFFAPRLFYLQDTQLLTEEAFGPILYIATYKKEKLAQVVETINATGYGLTFGLHSRLESNIQMVIDKISAGNIYINRNVIGAVVGSQPFGGVGFSGTGPKAGGPNYLKKFIHEYTVSNNISAFGGNYQLLLLDTE